MTDTLTFLFTDIENSTSLWEKSPDAMKVALGQHDELLKTSVESHNGRIVKNMGDGIYAVFDSASDGVASALAAQEALSNEVWPDGIDGLKIRIGLNSGESHERDGDYFGPALNLAARVMAIGHGGQVLVSENTAKLFADQLPPDAALIDQGEHRLKGISKNEQVYQLKHPALGAEFPPLRSLALYKHNLPLQRTSFVGREKELTDVRRLLKDTHLLTLLGPGGTGKTRLTLQIGEEVIEEYPDGVWLVELAPVTDPDLIPDRVATALHVQEQQGRSLLEALVDYLRPKELLLLLDNVEHLVRESAELAEHLLDHCPKLKILVTGREALFISGETTVQIPSLSLPKGKGESAFEDVEKAEGVQLFVERAKSVRPDFELTPQNALAVTEVVRRLDGIPLALELAASRLRMMTIEQIAERLADRFRLLTGGSRTALPRQQTLEALIDWSWNILGEKEQLLLMRLSVFSGSLSLDGAQKITSDEELDEFEVFDSLEQLVNKSLVKVDHLEGNEARYSMLETIRQYARDKLFETGQGETLRNRHADYFVAFSEEAFPNMMSAEIIVWAERIVLELDNIRAVLAWAQEDHPIVAIKITGNLLFNNAHWLTLKEAREWIEPMVPKGRELLDSPGSTMETADFIKVLLGMGAVNAGQGRTSEASPFLMEATQLAKENGEQYLYVLAIFLNIIHRVFGITMDDIEKIEEGIRISGEIGDGAFKGCFMIFAYLIFTRNGEEEKAQSYYTEGVDLLRENNNPRISGGIDSLIAWANIQNGNFDEAKQELIIAHENYMAINHQQFARMAQSNLAHIYRREGNLEEAERLYRETILGWQEQGQLPAVAHQLECFAYMSIEGQNFEHAAKLLGVAINTREELDAESTDPEELAELEGTMQSLAEAMGEAERDAAIEAGRKIDLDDAVLMALGKA